MYLPQMRVLRLPRYEYTFRDHRTGGVFAGCADELSLAHATIFADVIGDMGLRGDTMYGSMMGAVNS